MSGWYAVKRGITSHPLFKGKPERLAVWMWLLDNVAWKDTTQDVKGHTVDVPRGAVCVSERRIADECGIGYQVVRTAIKRFKSEHMVASKLTHGKSVITLCNYEKYQDPESDNNATLTQPQRNVNAQKKQGNKVTTEETKVSLAKKRGSRLPDDWSLPMAWGEWAMGEGWAEQSIRIEAEKFRDYWISKSGQSATKRDWLATWRNWMRNSKSPRIIEGGFPNGSAINHTPNRPGNRTDPALEQIARLAGLSQASGHGRG